MIVKYIWHRKRKVRPPNYPYGYITKYWHGWFLLGFIPVYIKQVDWAWSGK